MTREVEIPQDITITEKWLFGMTFIDAIKLVIFAAVGIIIPGALKLALLPTLLIFLPFLMVGFAFAFWKPNGENLETHLWNVIQYKSNPRTYAGRSCRNIIPLAEMKDGMVVYSGGDTFIKIINVEGVSYSYLSPDTQDRLTRQYEAFLNSLDSNCHALNTTKPFDPTPYTQDLDTKAKKLPKGNIKRKVIEDEIKQFSDISKKSSVYLRDYYVVLQARMKTEAPGLYKIEPIDHSRIERQAQQLLTNRAEIVGAKLRAMGLDYKILQSREIEDVLKACYGGV